MAHGGTPSAHQTAQTSTYLKNCATYLGQCAAARAQVQCVWSRQSQSKSPNLPVQDACLALRLQKRTAIARPRVCRQKLRLTQH